VLTVGMIFERLAKILLPLRGMSHRRYDQLTKIWLDGTRPKWHLPIGEVQEKTWAFHAEIAVFE